ncbi:putative transposase [Geothermobacter ehrlichii]|uniref:Putative transposase n=1 Tax=Geothermobacter ehrlichii TaxID=213224 RepID=A0A5D3WLB9_9BACT|nr:transposase [Geothermobacter ehrlichii]TYO99231.1 putative transposase [Geothermobacter ehrlichii]
MPRAARIILEGYPHYILQRGHDRRPVFHDVGDYLAFIGQLRRFRDQYRLAIWAWCLMPDHVHLLAVPRDGEGLAKGMGSVSLVHAQYLNRKYGGNGRIWHNRYFSCVVDGKERVRTAVGHIELNPVRAGKVRRPEEWPWSSARFHLLGKRDPLATAFPGYPGPEVWRDILAAPNPDAADALRRATRSGRPFAGEELIAELERRTGRRLRPGRPGRPRKQKAGSCP